MRLWLIALVEGLIAGISPCVLPVLPVVFAGWAAQNDATSRERTRRSLAVVVGVVLSFTAVTLGGDALLDATHLPSVTIEFVGLVLVGVIGVGLIVPRIDRVLERPFRHLAVQPAISTGSGLVLGVGLGAVFAPCAGPILSSLILVGDRRTVNAASVVLSLLFTIGAVLPMTVLALAGDRLLARASIMRGLAKWARPVGGVLLIVMAIGIGLNWFQSLQTSVPSYTASLQNTFENNGYTREQIYALRNDKPTDGQISACGASQDVLERCGYAPGFSDITAWLNTPHDGPLTWASLRGKVVLVDFWTYSCINCQRTLPHIEAWQRTYGHDGFVVIGVEAPEFAFEHNVSNIADAARALGVDYPIAVDDQLSTFAAYGAEGWPTEFLVNPTGLVVHETDVEGDYGTTEALIRQLLTIAHPGLSLPPPTNVPDRTPNFYEESPETYLGTDQDEHAVYLDNSELVPNQVVTYPLRASPPLFTYTMGGKWLATTQYVQAEGDSALTISVEGTDVYLVLGGTGTVTVSFDGATHLVHVRGYPTLYTLESFSKVTTGTLHLSVSRGVQAYDFTFG